MFDFESLYLVMFVPGFVLPLWPQWHTQARPPSDTRRRPWHTAARWRCACYTDARGRKGL
jgi:hypothetical protein